MKYLLNNLSSVLKNSPEKTVEFMYLAVEKIQLMCKKKNNQKISRTLMTCGTMSIDEAIYDHYLRSGHEFGKFFI